MTDSSFMRRNYLFTNAEMRYISISTFLLLVMLAGCQTARTVVASTDRVIVDGIIDGSLDHYDPKSKLAYGINIDSSHLYLQVQTTDPDKQRAIASNGFTLWIDGEGRKRKKLGIVYPRPNPDARRQSGTREGKNIKGPADGVLAMHVSKLEPVAEIIGFYGDEPLVIDWSQLKIDMRAVVGYDNTQKSISYEIKIPLGYIYRDSQISNKGIMTGLFLNTTLKSAPPEMAGRPRGGLAMGGKGSTGPGGMGGRGKRGDGMPSDSPIQPQYEEGLWVLVRSQLR